MLTSFQWAPTTCALETCTCYQSMSYCASSPADVSVYLAWTGTDSSGILVLLLQGATLTSFNRDIYRFTHIFV